MVEIWDLMGQLQGMLNDFGFYDGEIVYYILYNGIKVLCFLMPFSVVYWVIKFITGGYYR